VLPQACKRLTKKVALGGSMKAVSSQNPICGIASLKCRRSLFHERRANRGLEVALGRPLYCRLRIRRQGFCEPMIASCWVNSEASVANVGGIQRAHEDCSIGHPTRPKWIQFSCTVWTGGCNYLTSRKAGSGRAKRITAAEEFLKRL
jgi:hypothetical protein